MEQQFSDMNENKLIKEYMILSRVQQNLEALSVYNPEFAQALKEVDADLKKIKGQLFFRYENHKRISLESVVFTGADLQEKMDKYLFHHSES